jgi:hypothetical protein
MFMNPFKLLASTMSLWLLQRRDVGKEQRLASSETRLQSQIISHAALATGMYSASVDESATSACSHKDHEMAAPSKRKTLPEMEW